MIAKISYVALGFLLAVVLTSTVNLFSSREAQLGKMDRLIGNTAPGDFVTERFAG